MWLGVAISTLAVIPPTAAGAGEANSSIRNGVLRAGDSVYCPVKERALPPYTIRVQTHIAGHYGTVTSTVTYPRLQLTVRSQCGDVVVFYSSTSGRGKKGPPRLPGRVVASAEFPANPVYKLPSGHCEWKATDGLRAGLELTGTNTSGGLSLFAYPFFDSRTQVKEKCGDGIFRATAYDAMVDGSPLVPSASVKICTGMEAACGAPGLGPPFSTSLDIAFEPTHKLTPLLSRLVAGKSFSLAYSFSTIESVPGTLRVIFTRVR
jgi:hypothetical protein